jgi:DNA-binding MarR family transcriptional regulator
MDVDHAKLYLENQLCFPLYAASRLTTKIYEPYLSHLDLTYPQYLVLLVLWEKDNLSVNEIGHKLILESNTLTPLLKRLEQKKLIKRNRSAQDERKVVISLTQKSEKLKNEAVTIPDKIVSTFSKSNILSTEVIEFQKTLYKLVDILNEKNR